MTTVDFELDTEDSTGIFYYAGIRKGQIIGLMAPHLLVKYLKLIPVYGSNRYTPDYLRDKKDRSYGFVYSSSDVFDISNSYELGYGRQKTGCPKPKTEKFIFLNHLGGEKFRAIIMETADVMKKQKNGKLKIAT